MIDLSRKDIKYKTVFINKYIDGVDNFDEVININFEVDVIILKKLIIVDNDADNPEDLFKISTNLIDEKTLITFPKNLVFYEFAGPSGLQNIQINQDINIPFQVKKGMGNINSIYNFSIKTFDNQSITNNKTFISLCLIFVKYNNS